MKKALNLSLLCLLFYSLGCKPTRDSPYDPQSPDYNKQVTIKGKVTNMIGMPLKNTLISAVSLNNKNIWSGKTDENGLFELTPDTGNYNVTAELLDYIPETTNVYISTGQKKEINFLLNGIPKIQYAKAISCNEDRGFPVGNIFWVDVSAGVSDTDGIQDIDSVKLVVELGVKNIQCSMAFQNGIYNVRIPSDSCPGRNIESLIGMPFILYVTDKKGTQTGSPNFYVSRIIYSLPFPVFPASNTLNSDTTFIWNKISASYSIVYKLTVLHSYMDTVLTIDNIPDTTVAVAVDSLMTPGSYLWRVEGMDGFGNISRSKLTIFTVQ